MFFTRDEESRKLKAALSAAGADMKSVKPWLKTYARTRKNAAKCASRYYDQKNMLEKLLSELKELESMIIGYRQLAGSDRSRFSEIIKAFRKYQGAFNNEFLISGADGDFHSTLASIVRIAPSYISKNEDPVIMHSEVENLIELTKEGLLREKPDMFALSFFYLNHSDREIADMTFAQKCEKVAEIYDREFAGQIRGMLTEEQAKQVLKNFCHI